MGCVTSVTTPRLSSSRTCCCHRAMPHSVPLVFPLLHPFLCSQKTTICSMRDMLESRSESWQPMCFSSCYLGIMRSILSKVNFIKSLLCLEWHIRTSQQTSYRLGTTCDSFPHPHFSQLRPARVLLHPCAQARTFQGIWGTVPPLTGVSMWGAGGWMLQDPLEGNDNAFSFLSYRN